MNQPATRPAYSRHDLEDLKALDREGLFRVLRSFDDRGLSDEAFALHAARLLDPDTIPALQEATDAKDTAGILDAVHAACLAGCTLAEGASPSRGDLREAQDILEHRFTFYDETHQLPDDIDWDHNPGTAHWGHDLNRFAYLGTLVDAFRASGEERFARKAVGLILDWIQKCDFGRAFVGTPYVFGSYLNEAIHCATWSGCLRQLLPAGQVEPLELLRILKSLHDQLAYLGIVTNGHAGNWPTIGCRGIFATLAVFPVLRDTDHFLRYATRTLAEQVEDQVLPDGVQDELTPHYHRCVIDNLLAAARSLRGMGRDLEPRTLSVLRKMVHYVQQTIVPDGSAQVAFNDGDPAAVPDIVSALAEVGLEELVSPPESLGPELFPYAGVAFLRQKQMDGDLYLAFDGGPFGRSHQHEDKLSFWLFAYGRSLIVDPGRHLYDMSEVSFLPHLRRTRAHSTITIDGADQNSRARPETWIARRPVPLDWSIGDGEVRACAAYDLGYGEDGAIDVVHRREIVFVQERFWIVFDRVEGSGERRIDSRFQFAPGELHLLGSGAHTCFADANLLLLANSSMPFSEVGVSAGEESPRAGWYSSRYGLIEPAPCLTFSTNTALPFLAATLLFPYRGDALPEASITLQDGTALIVTAETGETSVTCGWALNR